MTRLAAWLRRRWARLVAFPCERCGARGPWGLWLAPTAPGRTEEARLCDGCAVLLHARGIVA